MKDIQNDVRRFWTEKQPFQNQPQYPKMPDSKIQVSMLASVGQEYQEIAEAFESNDLPKMADAIIDTIYTLVGVAIASGIDLAPLWAEVQRANMDKLPAAPGTNGRKTAEGRSCKPEGWRPPCIELLLHQQAEDYAQGYSEYGIHP